MHETSTSPVAKKAWLCSSCGREWDSVWTRKDTIKDIPRVYKEAPWHELPALLIMGPLMEVLLLVMNHARCPICEGKCVKQR